MWGRVETSSNDIYTASENSAPIIGSPENALLFTKESGVLRLTSGDRTFSKASLTISGTDPDKNAPIVLGDITSGVVLGGFSSWGSNIVASSISKLYSVSGDTITFTDLTISGSYTQGGSQFFAAGDATSGFIGNRVTTIHTAAFNNDWKKYDISGSTITFTALTVSGTNFTNCYYITRNLNKNNGILFNKVGSAHNKLKKYVIDYTANTVTLTDLTVSGDTLPSSVPTVLADGSKAIAAYKTTDGNIYFYVEVSGTVANVQQILTVEDTRTGSEYQQPGGLIEDSLWGNGWTGSVTLRSISRLSIIRGEVQSGGSGTLTAIDAGTGIRVDDGATDTPEVNIADSGVGTTQLADASVTHDKLATDAVENENIKDGTIEADKLEATNTPVDGQIVTYDSATGGFTWEPKPSGGGGGGGDLTGIDAGTGIRIDDGATDTPEVNIADGGVGTTQLADSGVTNAKIGDGQVSNAKIVDGTIEADKLEATNSPTDGQVPGYNAATGGVTWAAAGSQGPQGQKGDKGDPGATGGTGPVGATGPTGAKGDKGEKGDTGDKGDKGDKGDTGSTGPRGLQGIQGIQGVPGTGGGDTLEDSDTTEITRANNKAKVNVKDDSITPDMLDADTTTKKTAFRTRIGISASGNTFDLDSDVSTGILALSNNDKFLISDSSVTGNPNRYIQWYALLAHIKNEVEVDFDLYADVTSPALPADDDRIVFADVSRSGEPNSYATFSAVTDYILSDDSITPQMLDADTTIKQAAMRTRIGAGTITSLLSGDGISVSGSGTQILTVAVDKTKVPYVSSPSTGEFVKKVGGGWETATVAQGDVTGINAGDGIKVANNNTATPQVSVDKTKVPYVPSPTTGEYLKKTATGWETATVSGGGGGGSDNISVHAWVHNYDYEEGMVVEVSQLGVNYLSSLSD